MLKKRNPSVIISVNPNNGQKVVKEKKCNLDSFVTSLGSANSIFVKNFNFQALNFLRGRRFKAKICML